MAKHIVEAQKTHFKETKSTLNQYTTGWGSRVNQLKREFAIEMVGGPCMVSESQKIAMVGSGISTGPGDHAVQDDRREVIDLRTVGCAVGIIAEHDSVKLYQLARVSQLCPFGSLLK